MPRTARGSALRAFEGAFVDDGGRAHVAVSLGDQFLSSQVRANAERMCPAKVIGELLPWVHHEGR